MGGLMEITKHVRLGDGSYLLLVDLGDGTTEREFRYAPLAADATVHEGGPELTEAEYVAMQKRETVLLLEAEAAAKVEVEV